ncbi:MAG TPA: PEP-CTERM sorting domain-containing protein [Longimicrobium sp.]|nr:PEP-CTERM sorting domain-containing protein [Longimicrobium sp.]
MRWKAVSAAAVLALSAAATDPAHAAVSSRTWLNMCGGNLPGITTCASVKLHVNGNLVTLSIQNLSGNYGSANSFIFTSISFFNANPAFGIPDAVEGNVTTMDGPYRTSNGSTPPPKWKVDNQNGSGGVFGLDFDAGTNGIDGGIASNCYNAHPAGSNDLWMTPACGGAGVTPGGPDPGWVVMTFSMTGFWDLDLTDTQWQIHGQSGPNGVSIKCTSGVDCMPTVPEPATMALVGTGLMGLFGAARRRRRREGVEEDGGSAAA